jgi:hypothetical protein
MAVRQTGFAILASASVQEVMDLGLVTEEELVERGIVKNVLDTYRRDRPPVLKPEDHPGPQPFPTSLREAESYRATLPSS